MNKGMWVAVTVATVVSVSFQSQNVFAKNINVLTSDHLPGEVLVKYRSQSLNKGTTSLNRQLVESLNESLGTNRVTNIEGLTTDKEIQKVTLASDENIAQAIETLQGNPNVEYAEPNYRVYAFEDGVPNDTEFKKLWGMNNQGTADAAGQVGTAGSDIHVLPLWKKGIVGNKKIVVAVIDTGIDWTHPDLVGNLYTNAGEVMTGRNGKDDDNNGFIDDVHGWNFFAKTFNSSDDHAHGTHCAGTIGGMGNNEKGVVGVNWNVTLMPVKFLSASGSGSTEGAINSINYARMMKVNVMSNSWGGGSFSQALMDAIKKTQEAGITFVAAAGNSKGNNDTTPTYPANYKVDNIISVAATDNQDKLASFSCYGATTVHVAAPGVKIFSSVKGGGYDTFSGTSMATPHVAGIAALMLSVNNRMRGADIKTRLIQSSDAVAGLKGKVVANGRVNANTAIMGRQK